MTRRFLLFALAILGLLAACVNSTPNNKETKGAECSMDNQENPNGTKPLAQMMRTMTNYCDSMRLDILAGRKVDSLRYPMPAFIEAEPTETNIKTPIFYALGGEFENAYRRLMSDTTNQAENYTVVIQQCRACHLNFCSGPLRKIDKLGLDYREP